MTSAAALLGFDDNLLSVVEGDLVMIEDVAPEDVLVAEHSNGGSHWRKAYDFDRAEINRSVNRAAVSKLPFEAGIWETDVAVEKRCRDGQITGEAGVNEREFFGGPSANGDANGKIGVVRTGYLRALSHRPIVRWPMRRKAKFPLPKVSIACSRT